jgi:uncharacterized membrane protein YhhN
MYDLLYYKKNFIRYILFLVGAIYIVFLYIDAATKDLGNIYSTWLKYSTIILCFIISLFIGSEGYDRRDRFLVQSARLFTVTADFFLLILCDYKYGIFCFCIVQIIYIIRHSFIARMGLSKLFLLIFTVVIILVSIITKINFTRINNVIITEAAFYGCILLISLYTALKTRKYLISIGMLLFFLCDINVALYNLTNSFIPGILMWLFYLPSQLLLSLSGFRANYLKQIVKG